MFYLLQREDTLKLHPRYFGKNLESAVLDELKRTTEGRCSGRYGYTILVAQLMDIGKGHLHEDTGFAHFLVKYSTIVFRPFRAEVLAAEVTSVNKTGFFCQAGPCQVFVSQYLMPDDYVYDDSGAPHFKTEDELRIEQHSLVRVRVVSTRLSADEISVVGTIKDDYLGPFEYVDEEQHDDDDDDNNN